MKEPWRKTNCIKILLAPPNEESDTKSSSSCYITQMLLLFLVLLLLTISMTYTIWQIHSANNSQTEPIHLADEDLERIILSIVNGSETFSELFIDDGESDEENMYVGEVQLVDENFHVLWSKNLDENNLRMLTELQKDKPLDLVADDQNAWYEDPSEEMIDLPRLIRSTNSIVRNDNEYAIVHQKTRYVNCERFKPVQRGKYLVTPSLYSLHKCYKYGVRMEELEKGLSRKEDGSMRYDLENLYVTCEEAFDDRMDELTDELRTDYERCKWSGALSEQRERFVEETFAAKLANGDESSRPQNLQSSTTARSLQEQKLDMDAFVECSHVEMELFEDYFESPSLESLHRCQKFGVTAKELEQGIAVNPQPDQLRFDVGSLYVSCRDVFAGFIDYVTNELKEDYRRCKRVGAISQEVQAAVEKKFYEAFYGDQSTAYPRTTTEKPSSAVSDASRPIYETTTTLSIESSATTEKTSTTMDIETTKRTRYAFANCKRIDGKTYQVCIKIVKIYRTPVQYI